MDELAGSYCMSGRLMKRWLAQPQSFRQPSHLAPRVDDGIVVNQYSIHEAYLTKQRPDTSKKEL